MSTQRHSAPNSRVFFDDFFFIWRSQSHFWRRHWGLACGATATSSISLGGMPL